MREKSFWFKMTSSFKSEPTTSYNMLLRTFDRLSEAKQSGKTGAVWAVVKGPMLRAFATYALTSLVNAMVTAVIDAARDDDDYETLLEKLKFAFIGDYRGKNVWQWITEFMGSNVGDSINPIKSLPWFSDIFSLAEGYDADRADLTIFEEILTQGKAIWTALTKGDMTYKKVFKLVDAFSKVIGIPFANVMRDVTAVWNTVFGRIDSTVKLQLSPETKQSGYNAFYYAIQNGGSQRGMVQFYWGSNKNKLAAMGIPLDLRQGADNYLHTKNGNVWSDIGGETDTDDDDYNADIDKRLRNNGFMKGCNQYCAGGPGTASMMRASNICVRRILFRETMDPDETYYIKFKTVMDDDTRFFYMDYMEYCAKDVYDNPEKPEDIW